MPDLSSELPPAAPPAGLLASPLMVKSGLLSVALHAGALGVVVLSSGLYEPARIGARGGPMSIEAINAPESLGELSKGQIAKERTPTLEDDPLLETALATPTAPLPVPPQVKVVHDAPPLPELEEPLLALVEPQPDSDAAAAPPKEPKPANSKVKANDATPPANDESASVATAPSAPPKPNAQVDSPADAKPPAAASSRPSAGSLGHAGNEGVSSPRFNANAPIAYPAEAVTQHLEGEVLLRLHIAADGRVTAVDIVRSSGHPVLDRAAADAVKLWQADPARLLGQPVATTAVLPVRFHM